MSIFDDYRNSSHPKYDKYLPADNLNLQQYDNYCIYEVAGITYYKKRPSNLPDSTPLEVAEIDSFVAWQRYDITPITINFRALVDRYHDPAT